METNQKVEFTQVISRGCVIDVHKKVIVSTVNGVGLKEETREFTSFTSSLTELRDWLIEKEVTHVAMESAGVYWKPVYHILEPSSMKVWIRKDSKWICKLLLAGFLKPSYIPPREQRELRDLTRYRKKLIGEIASEKNRIIRVLEDCNVKLSCSKTDLYEACKGYMTGHNIYMLQLIQENIVSLESNVSELNQRIREVLSPYENVIDLLKKVPGLSTKTVEDLIAEIGVDMSAFPSEKHIASWAGISLGNNESADKKSSRITPGNKHVKSVLTEAAWAATRTKDTFYSARYHRLAARRGKKRALIAVGHSILKTVYHILAENVSYNELGADY